MKHGITPIADGIVFVWNGSYGGLVLDDNRVKALPDDYEPMYGPKDRPNWAECNSDMPRVLNHFGLGDQFKKIMSGETSLAEIEEGLDPDA